MLHALDTYAPKVILGLVFLSSTVGKLRNPSAFVNTYRPTLRRFTLPTLCSAVTAEILILVGLPIKPLTVSDGLLAVAFLVAATWIYGASVYRTGRSTCGCWGEDRDVTFSGDTTEIVETLRPTNVFFRNGAILGIVLWMEHARGPLSFQERDGIWLALALGLVWLPLFLAQIVLTWRMFRLVKGGQNPFTEDYRIRSRFLRAGTCRRTISGSSKSRDAIVHLSQTHTV